MMRISAFRPSFSTLCQVAIRSHVTKVQTTSVRTLAAARQIHSNVEKWQSTPFMGASTPPSSFSQKKIVCLGQNGHSENSSHSTSFLAAGIIGATLCGMLHENQAHAASKEVNIEEEIKRILSLTSGNSLEAAQAKKAIDACAGKDIVMFVGNSKAAKTTTVNLLIGNELTAVPDEFKDDFIITLGKKVDAKKAPQIGQKKGAAETHVPSTWMADKTLTSLIPQVIVDVPGFDDSRGPAQDIANAFYISEILKSAKSVKLVLICDSVDITSDNQNGFKNLINKVDEIFSGSPEIMNSSSIIFTKCKKAGTEHITARLASMLKNGVIKQGEQMVKHFKDTPNSIGIFMRPTVERVIGKEEAHSIASTVKNAQAVHLVTDKIRLGIAAESKNFLNNAHRHFADREKIAPVINSVETFFQKHIDNCKSAIESKDRARIEKAKQDLLAIQQASPTQASLIRFSEKDCLDVLNSLGKLDPKIETTIPSVASLVKFISFVDNILMTSDMSNWFHSINSKLLEQHLRLSEYIDRTKVALQELTEAERLRIQHERDIAYTRMQQILQTEIEQLQKEMENLQIGAKATQALAVLMGHPEVAGGIQLLVDNLMATREKRLAKAMAEMEQLETTGRLDSKS